MKISTRTLATAAAGTLTLLLAAPARSQTPLPGLLARIAGMQQASATNGTGSGNFVIPTLVAGRVEAMLLDTVGEEVFALNADLTRWIPLGGGDEQGGLYGELRAPDRGGRIVTVALVEGTWVQHLDGTGEVAALIKVSTGKVGQPLVVVGTIDGTFAAPTLTLGNPRVPGKIYLRWRIFA